MLGKLFKRGVVKQMNPVRRLRLQVEVLEDRSVPAILTVGPGKMFATIGAAAGAANSGDTIRIDPITLSGANAYAVFTDSNLIVEGAGPGRTVVDATGYSLPNRKGLFTVSSAASNFTVRNIEFKGAHDAAALDKNWAGIRQESAGLTVTNCYFHDNDNGILGGAGATSDIVIEYSEFFRNGFGDGQSHNMYIGDARSLTLRYCYSHDALVGHDVKSRAITNYLLYNWIGATGIGTESYEINLPDGGTSYIIGNVIRQDSRTGNSTIVDWGSENNGGANPSNGIFIVNNTIVNDRSAGTYVRVGGGIYPASIRLVNNLFAGSGAGGSTIYSGPTAQMTTNLTSANPGFVNAGALDYHLTSSAAAAIDDGTAPGIGAGFNLTPTNQYVAVANTQPRPVVGPLDIGAFEFGSGSLPTVSFTAASQSGSESIGAMTVTAQLSATSSQTVTVPFTVSGTATGGGSDYTISASPITIPAGALTGTITITVVNNALLEANETVIATMGTPTNATLGATTVHTATITDNDSLNINFQPAAAPVPTGYLVDAGPIYASRGNGWSYGWNTNNSGSTRDRNNPLSPDQRYDTLNHFGNNFWEVGIPNGTYTVHVVAGDPSYINSVYKINAEGALLLSGTPTSSVRWIEATGTVTVSDGRLTLSVGAGGSNVKINYVDISAAQALQADPVSTPPLAYQGAGLTSAEVEPLLTEAIARWEAAGADTSALSAVDVRIADLADGLLGLAGNHTIWLDRNAAGHGWFIDATTGDDSEFTTPGDQGEEGRMDLLTAIVHEMGHLLGHDHDEGVMAETLATGVRQMPMREVDARVATGWSFSDLPEALQGTISRKRGR